LTNLTYKVKRTMTNTLVEIDINNVVLFKKVKLPLNKYPLVVVRGENLDLKEKEAANHCGKTLGFSLIPTVRYGSPPSSIKKKDARTVHDAKSSIRLRWDSNGHVYDALQFSKGKSVGYDLLVDGKAGKFRKSVDAQEAIAKTLPINESQFYSFVYISDNAHALQRATSAARFDFFEKVFNLDIYDKIAKEIGKEYSALKFESQKLKELEAERVLRASTMPKGSLKTLHEKRESLVERAERVRVKVDKYLKELRHITAYMTVSQDLNNKLTIPLVKKSLEEMRLDESKLSKLLAESIAYYATYKEEKKRQERRQELVSKLAFFKSKVSIEDKDKYKKQLERLRDQMADMRSRIANDKANAATREQAWQEVLATGASKKQRAKWNQYTVEKIKNGLVKERHKIAIWDRSSTGLVDVKEDESVCPTCNHALSAKARAKLLDDNERNIEESRQRIKQWQKVSLYLEKKEAYNSIKYDKDVDIAKHEEAYAKFTERFTLAKKNYQAAEELEAINKELKKLPHVELNEKKVTKPEAFEDNLKGLRSRIQSAESTLSQLRKLKSLEVVYPSYDDAKQRYEQLQAYIDKYQPILEKAQTALHRMTVEVTRAESLADELKVLSGKIDKHRDASADFKVYEALRLAYGAKGLRKMRIAAIAAAFEQNLNFYAPRIFNAPISFRINITTSQFDILATRNGKPESDVRSLSGMERRAFHLLVLLSLLPFIPAHARCNLVVLDEIESGLDKPSRTKLVNEFIPLLNTLVPNVVLITPNTEKFFPVPNAVTYLVQKKNNFSKVYIIENGERKLAA
jgi:DNA repair exonuclease SbcCD ATPase subunit